MQFSLILINNSTNDAECLQNRLRQPTPFVMYLSDENRSKAESIQHFMLHIENYKTYILKLNREAINDLNMRASGVILM